MRCKKVLLMVSILVLPGCVSLAETQDATINATEVPSISVTQAIAIAKAALGTNEQQFVCTAAISKRQQYGGGWGLWFRSASLNTRYVHVVDSGKVATHNDASPKGGQFKVPPTLSTHDVLACAVKNSPNAVVLSAVWVEERNEWQVGLLGDKDHIVTLVVDANMRVSTLRL
jgi:hypothetical protein